MNYALFLFSYLFVGLIVLYTYIILIEKIFQIPNHSPDGKARIDHYSWKSILAICLFGVVQNALFSYWLLSERPSALWVVLCFFFPGVWKCGVVFLMIILRHNVFNDETGTEPIDFYSSSGPVYISYTEILLQYCGFTAIPLMLTNMLVASPPEWNYPINIKIIIIINYIIVNFPILIPDKLSKWIGDDMRDKGRYIYGIMLLLGVFETTALVFISFIYVQLYVF